MRVMTVMEGEDMSAQGDIRFNDFASSWKPNLPHAMEWDSVAS